MDLAAESPITWRRLLGEKFEGFQRFRRRDDLVPATESPAEPVEDGRLVVETKDAWPIRHGSNGSFVFRILLVRRRRTTHRREMRSA